MGFPTLTIEYQTCRKGRLRKGRRFQAHLVGYLAGDGLWDAGESGKRIRPLWISLFASAQAMAPFVANFRTGHPAGTQTDAFEVLKTAGHRWTTQAVPGGVVSTGYLPELFALTPTTSQEQGVSFVLAPPSWWLDAQEAELAEELGEEARETARAAFFAAFLDRRTNLPILRDLRFHLRLYRAALAEEWLWPPREPCYRSYAFRGTGFDQAGLELPLACHVSRPRLDAFLTEQTRLFGDLTDGSTRLPADRRLLPDTFSPVPAPGLTAAVGAT